MLKISLCFNFHNRRDFERGFSLIEVMVVHAIMSIISIGMADYISNITNQQRTMMQNTEALSIDTNLTSLMAPATGNCTGNVYAADITFTGSPPTTACLAGPSGSGCAHQSLHYYNSSGAALAKDIITGTNLDSTGLEVSSVELTNISGTGPYTANVVINFTSAIPPDPPSFELPAPIMLNTSTSGGSTKFQSCSATACATGYTLVSNGSGDQFCINTHANPPSMFPQAMRACLSSSPMAQVCSQQQWVDACLWDRITNGGPPYDDGGVRLDMGEQVWGSGGNGNPGGTSEWVNQLNMARTGGTNWFHSATIMGGAASVGPQQHKCYSFQQWTNPHGNQFLNTYYSYRCCYQP